MRGSVVWGKQMIRKAGQMEMKNYTAFNKFHSNNCSGCNSYPQNTCKMCAHKLYSETQQAASIQALRLQLAFTLYIVSSANMLVRVHCTIISD